jgi:hypothetical protein
MKITDVISPEELERGLLELKRMSSDEVKATQAAVVAYAQQLAPIMNLADFQMAMGVLTAIHLNLERKP